VCRIRFLLKIFRYILKNAWAELHSKLHGEKRNQEIETLSVLILGDFAVLVQTCDVPWLVKM
jgi:hypothetical protein